MTQKVNLAGKELHPQRKGKPPSKGQGSSKLIKLRPETYFRLLELEEDLWLALKRQGKRRSKNAAVSFLLDFYEKAKNAKPEGV